LVVELRLRVALFLGWHEACTFWSLLGSTIQSSGCGEWRQLVAAFVTDRGHDETFLADVSTLRGASRYRSLLEAYEELHPSVVKKAFSHRFSPNRMLEHIFIVDDAPLLKLLIDTHRRLHVEASSMLQAIERRAMRCLEVLFAESLPPAVSSPTAAGPRVRIDYPRWHASSEEKRENFVDFRRFPQRFLWHAALTRELPLCELVLEHLRAATPSTGSEAARRRPLLLAACCGAACGLEPLLALCGATVLAGPLARVTFRAPATMSSLEVSFDDAPLAVVAAVRGCVSSLGTLAFCGVELRLCTPRGLNAVEAARRHPSAELRTRLLAVLRSAGVAGAGGSPGAADSSAGRVEGHDESDPLTAAIERGDLAAVQEMLHFGARFEAADIMSAVRSGDLDVLSFVQTQCASGNSQAEYRQMMRQTATQIREESRGRRRTLPGGGSSSALRQAGGSMVLPSLHKALQ